MSITLRFDGGSAPTNPGPTAGAYVIYKDDKIILKGGSFLEHGTNNIGEYTGLIKGLEKCIQVGVKNLHVEGDSLLVISQVKGVWKVKQDHLKKLCDYAKELSQKFSSITFTHIRREFNGDADKMSDMILEKKCDIPDMLDVLDILDRIDEAEKEKEDLLKKQENEKNKLREERQRLVDRIQEIDRLLEEKDEKDRK